MIKKLVFGILVLLPLISADNCPQDKEIECVTDVNHGIYFYYLLSIRSL